MCVQHLVINKKQLIYKKLFLKKILPILLVAYSLGILYLREIEPKRAENIFRYLKVQDTLNPNYPYQLGKALALQQEKYKMGQSYLDAFVIDTFAFKQCLRSCKIF